MPHRLFTAGYVGLVLATGWAVNHASESRSTQKLVTLQHTCERVGNPGRALDRLDARGNTLQRRERFQPVVDCRRTYFENEGEPVPLAFEEQIRYIEMIRRGILPVVRADGTVSAPR